VTEEDSMGTAADRTVRVLTAGIVAAALGMVGCGPHAAALPAGFPNLDSFSPVPVDNYITTGPKGPKRFVSFSTPYNIECNFIATNDPVPAGDSQGILCDGEIPGVASGPTPTESCAIGKVGDTGTSGFRVERELTNCPIGSFNSGTLLNVGQKVSYQNATCAVGGDGLVACLDTSLGQHGFVLKPSGNVTF
jgi:hypothetical protein